MRMVRLGWCAGAAALAALGVSGTALARQRPAQAPTSRQAPAPQAPAAQQPPVDPWGDQPSPAAGGRPGEPDRRGGSRIFVSPAGEVYRPGPGERPFANWFRRADADGDGAITWDEFRADFTRVFAIFDTDADAEIEPEEVTRYETELLPEMGSTYGVSGRGSRDSWGGAARRVRNGSQSGGGSGSSVRYSASMTGAARFGLLPIPHPIMEADLNFNRGVTREEWDRAAQRRFTALDAAHNGRLTVTGLLQGRIDSMGDLPRGAGERRRERDRPRVAPGAGGTPLPRD